tara:strand:- start:523 stop:1041 length:519 start_codon:yes stop_codon:yes gene_type:complete
MIIKYNTHVLLNTKYKLIDLNQVFTHSNIEHVKEIFKNCITNKNITKKYFYHIYIKNICNSIIDNNKKYIPVLIYQSNNADISVEENKIFEKFIKMLPIRNINTSVTFSFFIKSLDDMGMREEICNVIFNNESKISCRRFYFSQIEKFCKRYELTFLDKKFFGDIKIKMLMI